MYTPLEEKSFIKWMRSNNQIFTSEEYNIRLSIWMQNWRLVQEHKKKNSSFSIGMNSLSALTPSEYSAMLSFRPISRTTHTLPKQSISNDVTIDWRDQHCVNPIKDQGMCGSCWAFSTIQSVEGQWAHFKGVLYSLSEQNLIDCCSKEYSCQGCSGGLMDGALKCALEKQDGQFMQESDYPYRYALSLPVPSKMFHNF